MEGAEKITYGSIVKEIEDALAAKGYEVENITRRGVSLEIHARDLKKVASLKEPLGCQN